MALETGLRLAALRVADVLHAYAKSKGWVRADYRIFMTVNSDWNLLHVTFVSDGFKTGSEAEEYQNFDDVMDLLQDQLSDEPELFRSVGLVLTPKDGYSFYGDPRLGPAEQEIPDSELNPDVSDWRGPFRKR